jgi:hypothetical protein
MDKSIHFFGTSVFGQLISLIDSKIIISSAKKHNSDRYVKRFKTKDHLISMLFCSFAKCTAIWQHLKNMPFLWFVSLGKQRNEHINKIDLAQADLQSAVKKVRVWHKAKP